MAEVLSAGTGNPLRRATRPIAVRYRGLSASVDVEGWFGEDETNGVLPLDGSRAFDRALNCLKARADGLTDPGDVRRIRKRLKLTQRQASAWLGGGANAFAKYETGDVLVSQAMSNLLRLLDKDLTLPDTLRLRAEAA